VFVTDSAGSPVNGASVTISGPTGKQGTTASDAKGNGRVEFNGLVDGSYTVAVSKTFALSLRAVSSSPSMEFGKEGESVAAQGTGQSAVPAGGTSTVTISLPLAGLVITELGFDGDFALTQWSSKAPIDDPVWKQSGNPDKPVCYKMESADVKLNVTVSMGSDKPVQNIGLRSGKLEKKVQVTLLTLAWSYTLDGGSSIPANTTGPHKIYQVFDTPKESPLYDLALDKSCGKCSGQSAIDDIAPKISNGIHADLVYNPAQDVPGKPPLGIYATGSCQCINNADLLVYLCRSCGIDAVVVWIWGGRSNTEVIYYSGVSGTVYGSFQVLAPKNGAAVQDPHFTFHAEPNINGKMYDPSYGNIGLITLNETAPGASRQTGPSYPPSTRLNATWKCPH